MELTMHTSLHNPEHDNCLSNSVCNTHPCLIDGAVTSQVPVEGSYQLHELWLLKGCQSSWSPPLSTSYWLTVFSIYWQDSRASSDLPWCPQSGVFGCRTFKEVKSDQHPSFNHLDPTVTSRGSSSNPLPKHTTPTTSATVDYLYHLPSSMNLHGYINRYLYLENIIKKKGTSNIRSFRQHCTDVIMHRTLPGAFDCKCGTRHSLSSKILPYLSKKHITQQGYSV